MPRNFFFYVMVICRENECQVMSMPLRTMSNHLASYHVLSVWALGRTVYQEGKDAVDKLEQAI